MPCSHATSARDQRGAAARHSKLGDWNRDHADEAALTRATGTTRAAPDRSPARFARNAADALSSTAWREPPLRTRALRRCLLQQEFAGHFHHDREWSVFFHALVTQAELPAECVRCTPRALSHRRRRWRRSGCAEIVTASRTWRAALRRRPRAPGLEALVRRFTRAALWRHIDAERNSVLLSYPQERGRLISAAACARELADWPIDEHGRGRRGATALGGPAAALPTERGRRAHAVLATSSVMPRLPTATPDKGPRSRTVDRSPEWKLSSTDRDAARKR